jgi:D-arabinose 1-dehydrogenase-like Zn-dependent alcohol dehydrogenase
MPQGVVCKNVGADYHTGLEICHIPKRKAKPGQIVINVLSCGIAFPDVLISVMGKHVTRWATLDDGKHSTMGNT